MRKVKFAPRASGESVNRQSRFRKAEDGFRRTTGEIRALTGTEPQTLEQFFGKDASAE